MTLTLVISGMQTGADRAGVFAAKASGIPTSGLMPLGFKAQDGNHPEYAELYGIYQDKSPDYPPRTEFNVKSSDATLRLATDWESAGELCTLKFLLKHNKPWMNVINCMELDHTPVKDVVDWIVNNQIKILNIAGNSERTAPGLQTWATNYLKAVFFDLHTRSIHKDIRV